MVVISLRVFGGGVDCEVEFVGDVSVRMKVERCFDCGFICCCDDEVLFKVDVVVVEVVDIFCWVGDLEGIF